MTAATTPEARPPVTDRAAYEAEVAALARAR